MIEIYCSKLLQLITEGLPQLFDYESEKALDEIQIINKDL